MIESSQRYNFLKSVVESLSEEQHELSLDATLFGSNGLPLKCSKLALGAMSPFLCNLLQESEEYGEDQVLIFPDVESADLESLCHVLTFTPGSVLSPRQIGQLQHLNIHLRWEGDKGLDDDFNVKIEKCELITEEERSELNSESHNVPLQFNSEQDALDCLPDSKAMFSQHSAARRLPSPVLCSSPLQDMKSSPELPETHQTLPDTVIDQHEDSFTLQDRIQSDSTEDLPINLSQPRSRAIQKGNIQFKDDLMGPRSGIKRKSKVRSSSKRSKIDNETGSTRPCCPICRKPFQSAEEIIFHLRSEHLQRPFKCTYCRQAFLDEAELENHKAVHELTEKNLFPCDQCNKEYQSLPSLQQHKRDHHAGLEFRCDLCDRVFKCNRYLQEHKLKRHTNLAKVECPICHKNFSSRSELVIHTTIHTNERPFECHFCMERFRTKNVLNTHILKHNGIKNKICDLCGHRFLHQGDLTKHMRAHTGAKPYSCTLCDSKFARKDYLNKHMKIHLTNERVTPEKAKGKRGSVERTGSLTPPLLLESLVPLALEVGTAGSIQVVSILNDTTQNLVIDGLEDSEDVEEPDQAMKDENKLNSRHEELTEIKESDQNIILNKLDTNAQRATKNDPFIA